jgi:hypothetical protein
MKIGGGVGGWKKLEKVHELIDGSLLGAVGSGQSY